MIDCARGTFGEPRRAEPKPRLFPADREFRTAGAMSAFDGAGEKFLAPAGTAAGIKKAPAECGRGGRKKASRRAEADGGTEFAFRPVVEKRVVEATGKLGRKYPALAASAGQGGIGRTVRTDVPGPYGQRWRTGNAHEPTERILPATSGRNRSIRTLMVCFAMVRRNARRAPNRAADADAAESGRRPAEERRAPSEFATLTAKFALEITMTDTGKRGRYLRRATWRVSGIRRAPRRRGRQQRPRPMPFRPRAGPVTPADRGGAPIRGRAAPRRSGAAVLHGAAGARGAARGPATRDRRSGPPLPRNVPADRGAACRPPAPREPIRSPDKSRPFWRSARHETGVHFQPQACVQSSARTPGLHDRAFCGSEDPLFPPE